MSVIDPAQIDWILFSRVAETAHAAVTAAKLHLETARRWHRAIDAAVEELHANPYFKFEDGKLLLLSETSHQLYEVEKNGAHRGCQAAALGYPCRHRAMRRLLDLYTEIAALPHVPRVDLEPQVKLEGVQPERSYLREAQVATIAPNTNRGETYCGYQI